MKNSESLQLVKEQLKIKSIELRKVEENNNMVNKKIKNLITVNQEEVKKSYKRPTNQLSFNRLEQR